MTSLSRSLGLLLSLIGSVVGYFVLQVLAAFVAFFLYGSGHGFDTKAGTVSAWFVALQLATAGSLFYRKAVLKTVTTLLIAVLTPLALFLYFEYRK